MAGAVTLPHNPVHDGPTPPMTPGFASLRDGADNWLGIVPQITQGTLDVLEIEDNRHALSSPAMSVDRQTAEMHAGSWWCFRWGGDNPMQAVQSDLPQVGV